MTVLLSRELAGRLRLPEEDDEGDERDGALKDRSSTGGHNQQALSLKGADPTWSSSSDTTGPIDVGTRSAASWVTARVRSVPRHQPNETVHRKQARANGCGVGGDVEGPGVKDLDAAFGDITVPPMLVAESVEQAPAS